MCKLYHLSLYKQGPEWPRVKLSLLQFPPKNVTSCYSANKNDAFHFQCVFICHLFLRFLFLMLCFHLSSFSRSYLKMSQSPHLLFLSFCVYFRHYPMLTLHCRFAFSSYTAILHSCCIPVAWFRVSFLSREKKTWKTMRWCCCSMLWKTSGSFWCLLCCSCSCLSHHWLPSTVVAYTHKWNLRKFSFPSSSSAFLLHLKMQFLTPHFFICPPFFYVFSFCYFPFRFLCSLFGREGGQTH